ncbi:hypothetical protein CBR_g57139 [Chara braunii]|uniref:Uncharacterized protein n=1 Tax=Chara braunii TaxID=69332 RepID=A0A388ME85_CHABU|nr:hypothetical protein CBR_g57139 [Chara braunii]|eukprot:GBG92789.1 hypothetical protein CBR_g57139 [Chara braunii]
MREGIQNGPCRIDEETEKELLIGEPGFLTRQEEDLVKELIREKHGAYAFNDDQRGRLDADKIEMIRIYTVPHEPWNVRGAKYPNPEDLRRVVEYLDGKIRTDVAGYSSEPYASPWFCFVKPNGVLRSVQDLQRLNAVTVRDARGLPNADQLSEACAGEHCQLVFDKEYCLDDDLTLVPVIGFFSMCRRDPWKEEAMAQRGAVAGPSGPTLRKGGQRGDQRVSRNLEELPIYGEGDSLQIFLRDLEEYAFRREYGDGEKIANVSGAGMYKRRIEGVVAGCTRWKVCKERLWKDMRVFPRDDVEDDLTFDETNLEDFIESLQLAAERGEWTKEARKKQLIARSEKSEKEEVKGIVEGSRTWKRITAELWIAYTQVRQDQTIKERLQEKGLWIGREVVEPQGKEAEDEEEDNVPLKRLKNKTRVSPKSSSKGSEQAEGDEQEEEEAAEGRKKNMGASMVPRKKKLGNRRAIESGRKEVQERVSEREEGVKEAGEGKKVQGGGKAPKVKRTEEE